MHIGPLRKQVAVQQELPTPDGAGGYALSWVTVAATWAEITPMAGREVFIDGHNESHVTHKITLRWRSDITITADMRILYNNRTFNIRAVINTDERNQFIEILADEGVAI